MTHPTWYLTDVKVKLLQKKYKTKEDWKHDVENVWKTARHYEGDNFLLMSVVDELQKNFAELTEPPPAVASASEWCAQVKAASDALNNCLARFPRIATVASPALISLPALTPLPSSAADRVIEAAAQLTSPQDAQAMVQIIQEVHPEMRISSPNLMIDFDALAPLAMWRIERYVKRRFRELGKKFPDEEPSLASD
jgi:hypothetical protein